jgi:5-methylcytosine-specific restriction endonuclease McrBC GTP-binding regulatory subunit McrB
MTELELDRNQLWSGFLVAWPSERVRQMTLEEYTNPNKDDAFIYWIESRLDKLGSIWGGSAFKFGIYCRDKTAVKEASGGRVWGEKYAWLSKFGATEQEAFATIRTRIVEVLDAVREGKIARIDEIDLAPVLKWKVAFLYQDRAKPVMFPVFKKEMLFFHYRGIDPRARLGSTPYHVMYETLLERHRDQGDVIEVGRALWEAYNADRDRAPRAWAVPLSWTIREADAVEVLCSKTKVEPEDVDAFLDNLLCAADMSEGDQIALLVEGDVRALGTLTNVEPGQWSWDQVPVNFPSGLLVNPTSEVRELDAAEEELLWGHLPDAEPGADVVLPPGSPRYWKIAPGRNAVAWPVWRERGIAAIGWPELGDLSDASRAEFDNRAARCEKEHGYTQGMVQVWKFRTIRPGDRIVANQGKHTALGIGTVQGGYCFRPGNHLVDGSDYAHQIDVRWEDTEPRTVEQAGWQRTVIELTKDEFDAIVGTKGADTPAVPKAQQAPALPCAPRNVILYGPPGTGKTYSTVRRALELILGPEKLEGLSDKGALALFREHQARDQIEFVTFHQAYGYEEFVEGIRPVLDQVADAGVRYEIHDGVFKRIALRAAAQGLDVEGAVLEFDELWEHLVRELSQEEGRTAVGQGGKTYRLAVSSQGNVRAHPCEQDAEGNITSVSDTYQVASKENARLYWKHRAELGPDPAKFSYEKTVELFARERGGQGGNHYTALWIAYTQLLALSRVAGARKLDLVDRTARVQQALDKPGQSTTFSFSAASPQYVLIVDEINRGNMSKILGELITLLEPDKRLTARNELKLPLSYTPQHRFAVPPNLHVLGTMNTADRSIALMDVALRRRFTFEELMPNVGIVRAALRERVANTAFVELVADVFKALNDRIRFLYDRDHQLGHSYFLDVSEPESLRMVFLDRILPMLQEYFYGSWDKICIVLGCPYDEAGEPRRRDAPHLLDPTAAKKAYAHPIVRAEVFSEHQTLGFDHDDHDDRIDYAVRERFASGTLSSEDLCRTFLGVLALDAQTFSARLAELQPEPVGGTESEVTGT